MFIDTYQNGPSEVGTFYEEHSVDEVRIEHSLASTGGSGASEGYWAIWLLGGGMVHADHLHRKTWGSEWGWKTTVVGLFSSWKTRILVV